MQNSRGLKTLVCMSAVLVGCQQQTPEPPIWEQVKISDLASDQSPEGDKTKLHALNLQVHVYCVPENNVEKMKDVWGMFRLRGPRYKNPEAFRENGFRVARGRITVWDTLALALARVQAQKERTVSFLLSPGFDSDLPLVNLSTARDISFTGVEEPKQRLRIGPGTLAWRLRVEEVGANLGQARLTAYPVFKLAGMGARLLLCDPHRVVVSGPTSLRGGTVESPDIRAGMAMLLAALAAQGETTIHNVAQIDRGYERIDERLAALGATIERVEVAPRS